MRPFTRADRVGIRLQKELADALIRHVKDPRLTTVTITAVQMSRDLRNARIYFVAYNGEKGREDASAGFAQARGYLKRFLARQLGLRYMPEVQFCYDDSFERGTRIEQLLMSLDAGDE